MSIDTKAPFLFGWAFFVPRQSLIAPEVMTAAFWPFHRVRARKPPFTMRGVFKRRKLIVKPRFVILIFAVPNPSRMLIVFSQRCDTMGQRLKQCF
jgi:hypothetical protein